MQLMRHDDAWLAWLRTLSLAIGRVSLPELDTVILRHNRRPEVHKDILLRLLGNLYVHIPIQTYQIQLRTPMACVKENPPFKSAGLLSYLSAALVFYSWIFNVPHAIAEIEAYPTKRTASLCSMYHKLNHPSHNHIWQQWRILDLISL